MVVFSRYKIIHTSRCSFLLTQAGKPMFYALLNSPQSLSLGPLCVAQ